MKENILHIGLGQCGNNIVFDLHKKGYDTLAINTSEEDLRLGMGDFNTLLVGNTGGSAKDRKTAGIIYKENYSLIKSKIEEIKKVKHKIIFIYAAGAGGTGSGFAPKLARDIKEEMNIKVFIVAVMPGLQDDAQSLVNAKNFLKDIYALNLPVWHINNNFIGKDINRLEEINNAVVRDIETLFKSRESDKMGNLDKMELFTLLTTPKSFVMSTVKFNKVIDIKENLIKEINNNHIVKPETAGEIKIQAYMLEIENKDNIKNIEIPFLLGKPIKEYKDISAGKNKITFIYSGLSYPVSFIEKINDKLKDFKVNDFKKDDGEKLKNVFSEDEDFGFDDGEEEEIDLSVFG